MTEDAAESVMQREVSQQLRPVTPQLSKGQSVEWVRRVERSTKHEEPPTGVQEMYELLTMSDGRVEGKLILEDLVEIFHECKLDGLGPRIPRVLPQALEP